MQPATAVTADVGLPDISLIRGGPLYRILRAAKLIRGDERDSLRLIIFAVAIGWLPVFLLTLLFRPDALASFLSNYRIMSRVLIAIPALLLGQRLMESRFTIVAEQIHKSHLLADGDLLHTDRFTTGLCQLRDSFLPELIILLLVATHTYFSIPSQLDATPWLATATEVGLRLTPAGWYTALVSATIFQFLMGLNLWRWLLWLIFAFRLSKLPLNLVPGHPDQRGGLGFLGLTPVAFAPVSFAATLVIGATWRHDILCNHAHLVDFKLPSIALVIVVVVVALLPLVFFVPRLADLRRSGVLEYSTLGQIQMTEFHEKWITHRAGRESKVLTEIESGNVIDYSSTYDRVNKLIPFPADVTSLVPLALSMLVPALPVVLAEIPIAVLLKSLFEALR